MSTRTVTLSGDALRGFEPLLSGPQPAAAVADFLPRTVRLGRIRPKAHPCTLRFGHYFDRSAASTPPPPSTNRRATASDALARRYRNDDLNDCVIAGKAHALGLWSGADRSPGGVVVATDAEIVDQYYSICGPDDEGCVITDVLDVMRSSRGFVAGGVAYSIDGYVSVDHADKLAVQVCIYLFGCLSIGINLPQAWTEEATWDVTDTQIVGGHDVTLVDYTEQGPVVSSWGNLYQMTWAALTRRTWVDECYALLAPLWYGADGLAPSGVKVADLRADLTKLAGGIIPPLPGPQPPPPPDPPLPPPPPPPPATEWPGLLIGYAGADNHEVGRWRSAQA